MLCNQIILRAPDNDFENNNAWKLEHNAEGLQEILNRIMQGISLSLICSKLYRLFLPAILKKITHYSYLFLYHYLLFLFYSFCFIVLCIDIQRNMDLIHNFVVAIVLSVSN